MAETDESGRFRYVNERFCAITGYSEVELLQLRFQDITHPDDLPTNLVSLQLEMEPIEADDEEHVHGPDCNH